MYGISGRPGVRKGAAMEESAKKTLRRLAAEYERPSFIEGDPSWFMHQAAGAANQEATAFVASSLSFGSRSQFMPKIQWLVDRADGDMDSWIRGGAFERDVPPDSSRCFYRFFTFGTVNAFLRTYRELMLAHGTLGGYVRGLAGGDAAKAVAAICGYFNAKGPSSVVPKDAKSACKRVCMFLRWMVRSGSPVDLGLWSGFIDRRTLVVPLDTHVVQEAVKLGLLKSPCASMCAARRLTDALGEAFPDDPARGDFALFGSGVDAAGR